MDEKAGGCFAGYNIAMCRDNTIRTTKNIIIYDIVQDNESDELMRMDERKKTTVCGIVE